MYKRLLLFVDAGETRLEQLEGLFDLVSQLRCRLIVLSVLPPGLENASDEEKKNREELEDRTWKFLYQIEDVAFGREIKVSLIMEDGEPEGRIGSVVKSYEVDMCVTYPYRTISAERLLAKLGTVPLLLLNQGAR